MTLTAQTPLRHNFTDIVTNRLETIVGLKTKNPDDLTYALINRQLKSVRHLNREAAESFPEVKTAIEEFNLVQSINWRNLNIIDQTPVVEKDDEQIDLLPVLTQDLKKLIEFTQQHDGAVA